MENKLKLVFGDVTLGVYGEKLSVTFSYTRGGMESLVIDGEEWLYHTPLPTFWRATTDNDRGNGFSKRSAMWMGADAFINCVDISVKVDSKAIPLPVAPENDSYTDNEEADSVCLCFTYETCTMPVTKVDVTYEVTAPGDIKVSVHYHGAADLPELPVFGLRFIIPSKVEGFVYKGLSGETYPDRMEGGIPGLYEVNGLPVTRYPVPQDCGVHMQTKWVTICRRTTFTFEAEGEEFAFSCLPYTALELENATHYEELPPARRTVLSILGAVRGVGGTDSWGSDVEEPWHISGEKDIQYAFVIRGEG